MQSLNSFLPQIYKYHHRRHHPKHTVNDTIAMNMYSNPSTPHKKPTQQQLQLRRKKRTSPMVQFPEPSGPTINQSNQHPAAIPHVSQNSSKRPLCACVLLSLWLWLLLLWVCVFSCACLLTFSINPVRLVGFIIDNVIAYCGMDRRFEKVW